MSFQRKLDGIFLDILGVTGIADDMVISGRSDLEHDKHLYQLSGSLQKEYSDLESRQDVQTSTSFILWTPVECQGAQSRSKEDCSSEKDELPQDVETMRSFLGLVNYLNRFSPHLAELSEPLRGRQDAEFELNDSVRVAFSRTKEEISKNVTLPYFNPKSATTLQTDASKKGLGAVILQDSRPVMFASRALTGAEKNYQNLERGMLSNDLGDGEISLLSLWQAVYT